MELPTWLKYPQDSTHRGWKLIIIFLAIGLENAKKSFYTTFLHFFAFFIVSEYIFGDFNRQKWAFMQKVTSDIFGLKWAVFVELQPTYLHFPPAFTFSFRNYVFQIAHFPFAITYFKPHIFAFAIAKCVFAFAFPTHSPYWRCMPFCLNKASRSPKNLRKLLAIPHYHHPHGFLSSCFCDSCFIIFIFSFYPQSEVRTI